MSSDASTIVTHGTIFKGELKLSGQLFIDGEFDGQIYSSNKVTIGKNGIVRGEVFAETLIVQGKYFGTVEVDHLQILSEGYVQGSILAMDMVIEPYAMFEGDSRKKTKNTETNKIKSEPLKKIEHI
jgi:cytoskeletal protein CcmA (bactofilin family)